MSELMKAMMDIARIKRKSYEVVIAEYDVSSTELHNIANGQCCTLNGKPFSIRFLLKDSFKSPRSNFVINKYVIQIIATPQKNFLRRSNIATLTKIIKTKSIAKKPARKEKQKVELKITDKKEELF